MMNADVDPLFFAELPPFFFAQLGLARMPQGTDLRLRLASVPAAQCGQFLLFVLRCRAF